MTRLDALRRTWIGGMAVLAAAGAHAVDWPQWRGADSNGAASGAAWRLGPDSSLAAAWEVPLGSGYSGISIADGRVVTAFTDGEHDLVAAFDATRGRELWRHAIDTVYVGHDGSHDGPLATPAIDGGRVFALGARGQLLALDAKSGKRLWSTHLVDDHGAEAPGYGFAASPVAVDGLVIVPTGASREEPKSVSAFDAETGRLMWQSGDERVVNHTPILTTIDGRKQLVIVTGGHVMGLAPRTGEVLWQHAHGGRGTAASAVPLGKGRLYLNPAWPEGLAVRVDRRDDVWSVGELWKGRGLTKSYNTPVEHEGFLYGFNGAFLTCVDATTGETRWKSRPPGDGFLIRVDDQLIVLTRKGTLHVIRATPEGYDELSRMTVLEDASWTAPSFAGGRIYVRGMSTLAAVSVADGRPARREASGGVPGIVPGSEFARFVTGLERAGDPGARVEAFLAKQKTFPIVEGDAIVHFVHRGAAEEVALSGDMFLGAPWYFVREQRPMHRVDGTDLFYYSMRLEPRARVNYRFSVDLGDPVVDPRNPRTVDVDRVGEMSTLTMPAWRAAGDLQPRSDRATGRVETFELQPERLGKKLEIDVYLPPGYDDGDARYPVLYVSDAKHALERGKVSTILDNRIGEDVAPTIAVFVRGTGWGDHLGDRRDDYLATLAHDVVAAVDGRYRTVANARGRAALGCGEGGVVSVLAALGYPSVFSRAGSLSAYILPDASVTLRDRVKSFPARKPSVYMDWGTYDLRTGENNLDLPEANRDLARLLEGAGFDVTAREVPEGFGWTTWRHRFGEAVAALLATP